VIISFRVSNSMRDLFSQRLPGPIRVAGRAKTGLRKDGTFFGTLLVANGIKPLEIWKIPRAQKRKKPR
jgi:hypothetical protein